MTIFRGAADIRHVNNSRIRLICISKNKLQHMEATSNAIMRCIPDALSVILRRTSVRNYTDEPVKREDIDRILHAAMAAPAAARLYPWKFIVIQNKDMLRFLGSALPFEKMLAEASLAIVVCAVPHEAFAGLPEYAILASTCASQNILLAAEALGLGAVWATVYPKKDLMDLLRIELNIPADVIPLNIIPIGYPAGEDMPCNKFDRANIRMEGWQ
jgi:nitroreductase